VSALADKQVVGLYFSAHWCPPCRGFTPKLAEVYTAIKGTGKSLEIVFVSSDRDDVAFDSYHKEMPWQTLSKRFKVSGIPSLVPCRRRDRPGALQGRPQRHHERPSGHRLSAPKTLDELLGEVLLDGEGAELPRDQGGSNAYRVGSFSMFDLCRWTSGPSGTPPPTVGRTTTAHARDDDQPQQELNAVGKGLWRPFDVVAAAALAGPSVRVCAVESSKRAKLGINFSRTSCAWNIHVYVTCVFSSQSNTTDCRTLLTPLVRFQVEMEANAVGDFVGGIGR